MREVNERGEGERVGGEGKVREREKGKGSKEGEREW